MLRPPGRRAAPPACRAPDVIGRVAVASLLALAAVTSAAFAQTYSRPTPSPRLTDPGSLAARIRDREVHERFARGVSAEERSDWSGAAAEFRRVIALDPPEPKGSSARYDLALAESRLGHDDVAAGLLQEALHRDPGFAAAAANLVAIQLRRGDGPAALAAAERYLAIAPTAFLARYGHGLAALRAGDLAAARADFRALDRRRSRRTPSRTTTSRSSSCAPAATTPRAPSSTAPSRCRPATRARASRWAPC